MSRSLQNVMRTRGPFFGLNEKTDETMLGPEYATALNNVLLHRGRIEPRPGFRLVRSLPDSRGIIKQMRVVASAQPDMNPEGISGVAAKAIVIAITNDGIGFHRERDLDYNEAAGEAIQADYVNASRGSIVVFRDQIYFMLERQGGSFASPIPAYDTGLVLRRLGQTPPPSASVEDEVKPEEPTPNIPEWHSDFPRGQYQFRVTFYDKANDVESNATDVAIGFPSADPLVPDDVADVSVPNIRLRMSVADPSQKHANLYVRIYARIIQLGDADSDADRAHGGAVTFRLVEELKLVHAGQVHSNGTGEDGGWLLWLDRRSLQIGTPYGSDPALSDAKGGPFSPTRNGVPPPSNTAVVYKDMMIYASIQVGSYGSIFFSEPGKPEHVSPADVIPFDDAGRKKTTALFVYQGRLIIFKQDAIYVLAGLITRKSNAYVALGIAAPAQQFQLYRTESNVGCYNVLGGNGAIECDGQLYFNSRQGIYKFDGMRSHKVSDAVDETFKAIPPYYRQQCTMANDDRNGLLWICYASPQTNELRGRATVLCYDYRRRNPNTGVGAWTVHTVFSGIACVATAAAAEEGGYQHDIIPPAFDGKALILAGVKSHFPNDPVDFYCIAELLEGELDDLGAVVYWSITVAPQDLRLPDRMKRWHYLTVDHERQTGFFTATSTVETPDGTMSRMSNFDANLSHTSKQRISLRGTRLELFLGGVQSSEYGSQIINGFSIDAEPLGRR